MSSKIAVGSESVATFFDKYVIFQLIGLRRIGVIHKRNQRKF